MTGRIAEVQKTCVPRPSISVTVFDDSEDGNHLWTDWGLRYVDRNCEWFAWSKQHIFYIIQGFPISWTTVHILNGIDNFTPYGEFFNQRRGLSEIGKNNFSRMVCGFPPNSSSSYGNYNPGSFRIHEGLCVRTSSFRANLRSLDLLPNKSKSNKSTTYANNGCPQISTIERISRLLIAAIFLWLWFWLCFFKARDSDRFLWLLGFFILGTVCLVLGISLLDSAFFGCGG